MSSQITQPEDPQENLKTGESLLDDQKPHIEVEVLERPEIRGQRESPPSIRSNTEHRNSEDSPPKEQNRNPGEQAAPSQRPASPKTIHSRTGPENPQEVLPDEQKQEEKQPELPKIWTIHDDFQFAPPKPDGDPW
ncbi:hypothetical protein GALMADRAFT_134652, partial [Galerina marginata CBS 339.88]